LAVGSRSRSIVAARHGRVSVRASAEGCEIKARSAWMAGKRVRKAVQARIVVAFRQYIEGAGPGPTDEELLTFARLAVAERRLERRLR
jgi:hypothetical protein